MMHDRERFEMKRMLVVIVVAAAVVLVVVVVEEAVAAAGELLAGIVAAGTAVVRTRKQLAQRWFVAAGAVAVVAGTEAVVVVAADIDTDAFQLPFVPSPISAAAGDTFPSAAVVEEGFAAEELHSKLARKSVLLPCRLVDGVLAIRH